MTEPQAVSQLLPGVPVGATGRPVAQRQPERAPALPWPLVTPGTLPEDAHAFARTERQSGRTVFLRAVSLYAQECKNCQGLREVYVTSCSHGPYSGWLAGTKGVWHEGDQSNLPGMYIIRETRGYACPVCSKSEQGKRPKSW